MPNPVIAAHLDPANALGRLRRRAVTRLGNPHLTQTVLTNRGCQ
jgi:hypothetical protein